MAKEYPSDRKIKEMYLRAVNEYPTKGSAWHVRITADDLSCPASYIRKVLTELEEKGEI